MKSLFLTMCALVLLFIAAVEAQDSYRYTRELRAGDRVRYEMQQQTEGVPGEMASVAEVFVQEDGRSQQVRWISATNTAQVANIRLYELFANPREVLRTLNATDATLTGIITDFYTFFFAASPLAGVTEVTTPGATYVRPTVITGDWSDATLFPLGQDHLQVTIRLRSLESAVAHFTTTFAPPVERSWAMHRPWMDEPVCASGPNNFQMVRRQGAQFIAVWGCEEFTIDSDVERSSGRILGAKMDNQLTWRVRVCQDEALAQCMDAPSINRRRTARLRIVP
jgi:hypothetical protein